MAVTFDISVMAGTAKVILEKSNLTCALW